MIKYPDISHYHPVTNWDKVKKEVGFLISKATQGTLFTDSTLDEFIKGCEKNKIPYYLYTFLVNADGLEQAKYLVSRCVGKTGAYFRGYIVDAEKNPSNGKKPTSSQVVTALKYLKTKGYKYGLYIGYTDYNYYKDAVEFVLNDDNAFFWEARYGLNNGKYNDKYPCHKKADLHQYTSLGKCSGISGNIDLNRLTGTKKMTWFTGEAKQNTTSDYVKTTLELVYEVMKGKHGNGDKRKKSLGERYNEVQAFINHIAESSTNALVKEVKNGKYGNGDIRKTVLGGRYKEVQNVINKNK